MNAGQMCLQRVPPSSAENGVVNKYNANSLGYLLKETWSHVIDHV